MMSSRPFAVAIACLLVATAGFAGGVGTIAVFTDTESVSGTFATSASFSEVAVDDSSQHNSTISQTNGATVEPTEDSNPGESSEPVDTRESETTPSNQTPVGNETVVDNEVPGGSETASDSQPTDDSTPSEETAAPTATDETDQDSPDDGTTDQSESDVESAGEIAPTDDGGDEPDSTPSHSLLS
ncbi:MULTISPECIES: hypothetical protein [Natronorubrum]|uniref:Uncharacterized protein n=2 Tax=Natronorubrum bangense TaxID=61858 RepID=A0A4D6HST3_9EURY|nr:hypothetical protein [Natronorubrum bangense]QCC56611.1 hypothetical protein DV706_19145 [Natronorubrum bangense]